MRYFPLIFLFAIIALVYGEEDFSLEPLDWPEHISSFTLEPSTSMDVASVFPLTTAEFSPAVSDTYARFALAAYCVNSNGQKSILDWSCLACKGTPKVTEVIPISLRSAKHIFFAYVGYVPQYKSVLVSFAGTDPLSIHAWLQDLNAFKDDHAACDGCKVHRGFNTAYQQSRKEIITAINKVLTKYPGTPIAITGHSFGAAMSILAAADLVNHYKLALPIYNFGAPRVGNEKFSKYLDNKFGHGFFRVVNERDPIVRVAPQIMGFRHNLREVLYTDNYKKHKVCSSTNAEDKSCSLKYLPLPTDILFYHTKYGNSDFAKTYTQCKLHP